MWHLLDFDYFGYLVFRLWSDARQFDTEYAIVHAGIDVALFHVFRQDKCLLELAVRKFTTQVTAFLFLVFFLVLGLLFHGDDQVAVFVDMDIEVFLVHAGSGYLYLVL